MEREKEIHPQKLKILLAEDCFVGVNLTEWMLRKLGHDVYKVEDGVNAVSFCRAREDIDLVIMDIMMPIMDGVEATQQIRQFNKEVIIIALLVYSLPDDLERFLEAGCNNSISKPFSITELEGLINQYFRKD